MAQSHKATLQQHTRRPKNRSLQHRLAFLKIFLALKAPSQTIQEARGNPTAHIRDAQLTAGQQTPRKYAVENLTLSPSPAQPDAAWSNASASAFFFFSGGLYLSISFSDNFLLVLPTCGHKYVKNVQVTFVFKSA